MRCLSAVDELIFEVNIKRYFLSLTLYNKYDCTIDQELQIRNDAAAGKTLRFHSLGGNTALC